MHSFVSLLVQSFRLANVQTLIWLFVVQFILTFVLLFILPYVLPFILLLVLLLFLPFVLQFFLPLVLPYCFFLGGMSSFISLNPIRKEAPKGLGFLRAF